MKVPPQGGTQPQDFQRPQRTTGCGDRAGSKCYCTTSPTEFGTQAPSCANRRRSHHHPLVGVEHAQFPVAPRHHLRGHLQGRFCRRDVVRDRNTLPRGEQSPSSSIRNSVAPSGVLMEMNQGHPGPCWCRQSSAKPSLAYQAAAAGASTTRSVGMASWGWVMTEKRRNSLAPDCAIRAGRLRRLGAAGRRRGAMHTGLRGAPRKRSPRRL